MSKLEMVNNIYDAQMCIVKILNKYDKTITVENYQDKTVGVLRNNDLAGNDLLKLQYYSNQTNNLCKKLKENEDNEK